MKNSVLALILALFCSLKANGQNKAVFPQLTKVSIDTEYGVVFGYDKKNTRLINKPLVGAAYSPPP